MLACPQDLYFHSDATFQAALHEMQNGTNPLSDCQYKNVKKMRKDSMLSNTDMDEMSNIVVTNKDKEEQVWPPDVEAAFIEALESIPKLGRRKILVNGKPCGRNELISDFIFRKTSKIRTRKQVSSHIQVLKNTRKGDIHFMRLLTDSSDGDENANSENRTTNNNNSNSSNTKSASKTKTQHHPYHHSHFHRIQHHHYPRHHGHHMPKTHIGGAVKMKNYQSVDSLSSDDSSINSSPSPTDYMLDMMYGDSAQQQLFNMLQFKDFYDPMQLTTTTTSNPMGLLDTDPFFGSDIMTPLLNQDETTHLLSTTQPMTDELLLSSLNMIKGTTSSKAIPSRFSLWPNYVCLYLEYPLPHDPCSRVSHTLSQMAHCYASCLPKTPIDSLPKEKCPPLLDFLKNTKEEVPLLHAKTKLDLNLNMANFAFNNTSFFEAQTRRTIECTTTIYSFGNVVLESKEVQQALWVNEGKYMYTFVFVNQFFDAFMKGIRSLKSWEEVDIAVNNLCIIQSFEDVETKYNQENNNSSSSSSSSSTSSSNSNSNNSPSSSSPLLVMLYEFERGNATIDVSIVGEEEQVELENELDFLDDNTLN